MHLSLPHCLVLAAFFELAQQDRAVSRPRIAEQTGLSPGELGTALVELELAGWVELDALRLTLPGLAVAVAVRGRARRHRVTRLLAA